MPAFLLKPSDPAFVVHECARCGEVITHRDGDPAHRTAMQKHTCPVKEGRK